MTLANGTRFGPYEIVSLIGAGGMGEVYRGRDTRLDRAVAIKVLRSDQTASEPLRARFEREARAISALSHPNICALYDVGHADGTEYLVMEYLEGETLADRIARGPLPLSHVLRYGVQIAEALQHAHRAGIAHRDLKPGNIMLTSSGIKLLDFGLAKLIEPAAHPTDPHAATLRADPLTASGSIVGTFPYMSPEQIEGKTLDHRSDLFSLGVILYEMVAGRRPFIGASGPSLMAAILSADPIAIRTLQPATPAALERIILTALEKHPDERWQTAQDVARQLRWLSESSGSVDAAALPSPQRRPSLGLVVAGTALAAGLLTWGATRWIAPKLAKAQSVRLHFAPPPELSLVRSYDTNLFAISPDGRTICFLASGGGSTALFLRPLESFQVKKVEGSEEASGPFWSSDGQWIAFSARGKLWKTRVSGGAAPEALCDVPPPGTLGSWKGRTILFSGARDSARRQLFRIPDSGGKPVPVTSLQAGEWRHSWPLLLPDGDHFLFLSFAADSLERDLFLASFTSPKRTLLLKNVSQTRLVGSDRLIFVKNAKLMTQRVDLENASVLGEPDVIADDVSYFQPSARGDFDASPSGTVVYRTDTSVGRLVLVDRKGAETRLIDDKEIFFDHSVSPDGKKAAVSVMKRANGLLDIWIYDLVRAVRERFTTEAGVALGPVWTPDGRSILYSETRAGTFPHIVRRSLAATTSEDVLPPGPFLTARSFSPDGLTLFYEQFVSATQEDIYTLSMKTRQSTPFLATNFDEGEPEASPDGKWIAYTADATGRTEVYIQNLSDGTDRVRVSTMGGSNPRWRRDSQELFFTTPARSVMSATPRSPGRWDDASVQELFAMAAQSRGFAVLPDGQAFLISYWTPGAGDSLFHVLVNLQ